MKKRFLALVLVMAMVLGMSTTAFAAYTDDYVTENEAVFTKEYDVNNGTAPAETFTFKFEAVKRLDNEGNDITEKVNNVVTNMPVLNDVTAVFADALEASETLYSRDVEIPLTASMFDAYGIGEYTYKMTEVNNHTAGVTYDTEELYLVVTILRDEKSTNHYVAAIHYESSVTGVKEGSLTNSYDAGTLTVKKEITGNTANMDQEFAFTVKLYAPAGETVRSTIDWETTGRESAEEGTLSTVDFKETVEEGITVYVATIEVSLGDGETLAINNLPEGVTYTISEDDAGYDATTDNIENCTTADGVIAANDNDAIEYTNDLTTKVDTGIFTTNMPYILALVAIAAVAVVMFRRKREF